MTHPRLGRVNVQINASSRRMTARWRAGALKVVVPQACPYDSLLRFLDDNVEALMARRPETPAIADGTVISLPLITLSFASDPKIPPGQIAAFRADDDRTLRILHHPSTDISDTARFSKVIEKAAGNLCGHLLINHAARLAASRRLCPRKWKLGSGKRVLGTCSTLGVITLSRMLLFLSSELMDYVILHELAHLKHHDHSPQFHALLDSYCGGREKELVARLHNYRWPIVT